MALQTQAMGMPVEGSRIVVPRLMREGRNGTEIFEPGASKLWKNAAISSRGNPVLAAALLPDAAQVPHTNQAAFAYGIAPADMPTNRPQPIVDPTIGAMPAAIVAPAKVGVALAMRR